MIWNRKGTYYRVLDSRQGDAVSVHIKATRKSIYVTHFTNVVPDEMYQTSMLERLRKGIHITRIVAREPKAHSDQYEWLKAYKADKNVKKNYTQIDMKGPAVLPIDIFILDEKTVVLHFPREVMNGHFQSAIVMQNEHVARLFQTLFERIRIAADASAGGTAEGNS